MIEKQYIVQRGDNLWDLAGKHLGDPMRWPEIYKHNNSPAVSARTGTKIVDPDLIFVGQKLYIPGTHTTAGSPFVSILKPPSAKPTPQPPSGKGKGKAKLKVRSIPFKYNLGELPSITEVSQTHITTVRRKGSITLQAKDAVDFATFNQKGFELTVKSEADHAFGKLATGTKVGFKPTTNEITFECGITSHSNVPYAPRTKVAAGISSKTGLPVLKGSIIAPTINGKIDKYIYVANSFGIEIEITPRPPTAKPKLVPVPSARPLVQQKSGWVYLIGGALVVGAGVYMVATIVQDILTLGAGVVDDVPSFAVAAKMFTSGITMFKAVHGGKPIQIEGHGVAPGQL